MIIEAIETASEDLNKYIAITLAIADKLKMITFIKKNN